MPGQSIQVFLKGLENKTYVVNIEQESTVAELWKKCEELTGLPDDDMRLITGTKEIRSQDHTGKIMHLEDYNIGNQSNLYVVLRLLGGSLPQNVEVHVESEETESEESVFVPKMYDAEVQLTDKPDMFTLDDDKGGQRAEMPCGHAISPESLTAFCRSLITAGKFELRCPYKKGVSDPICNTLWELFTVKRLAVLTKAEVKEFETKMTENYLRKAVGIQECPRCCSFCERKCKRDKRVVCPICTKKSKKSYDFCWYCLKTWLTSGTSECGNLNCTGEDPRLRIIKNCPKKEVVGVRECPAIRACPKCGMLIEHKADCKQMSCPCGQKFCFICLTKANSGGRYQCGAWNFKCKIAPVQTALPGDD